MLFTAYKEQNMPVEGVKVAVLAPQLALLAPQLSQKTAMWWLSSKTVNLAKLLKK
jgi:hypothetical protein